MATRADVDAWMWAEACALIDEADRLQRQFFHLAPVERTPPAWAPPVDVFEDEREIVDRRRHAGRSGERRAVASEPGVLVVRGARPLPLAGSRHRVRQLEIPYGEFERRIALPPGRLEIGVPELIQGCLIVSVRKIGQNR